MSQSRFVHLSVHWIPDVQGKVDAVAEIDKLEKKSALAVSNKEKLAKVMSQANYETTVREDVRAGNDEKMEKVETEIETLRQAIERFKTFM